MLYKIGRNPIYRAPIPALIGGINTNSSSDIVADNQFSNCLNMMAMDGILRTRPGFKILNTDERKGYLSLLSNLQSTAMKVKKYDFTIELNGEYGKLISIWGSNKIEFFLCCPDGSNMSAGSIDAGTAVIKNEFTIVFSDGLYCFVTTDDKEEEYHIYKSFVKSEKGLQILTWLEVKKDGYTDEETNFGVPGIYVPTVMTNCRSDGVESSGMLSGSSLLGYNLLGTKYSIEITAFNEMCSYYYHKAVYRLPNMAPAGTKVLITYRNEKGLEKKRYINVSSQEWCFAQKYSIDEVDDDRFYFALHNQEVLIIYKERENGIPVVANVTDSTDWLQTEIDEAGRDNVMNTLVVLPGLNNIIVTAEFELHDDSKKRVFSATCSAWFGGNRGLASGTRLFIGGMEGNYKNVLQWSDISNPLYFPENCYSEVGDPSSAITGFGKQADSLYIFKPNEIHAANYVFNEFNADDLSANFITDLTVTTAIFPLTQISGEIGCDCPGTIQLCRNRLCWAHSNGKVYTLVSSSQYNEKNIYELSDPIRRAIPNISPWLLKRATSADWDGYYVLSVGEHIFLMQYESYGYSKIYSYTSEEAASHKLPWFYLKTPCNPWAVLSVENQLLLLGTFGPQIEGENPQLAVVLYRADKDSVTDDIFFCEYNKTTQKLENFRITEQKIPSMVQSKIFDFSRPEIKKQICHILAEIGGTSGNSITLSVISDRSRKSDFVESSGSVSPLSEHNEYIPEVKRIITPVAETIERTVTIYEGGTVEPKDLKLLDSSAPDFFRMIRVNPALSGIRKFAIQISSDGAFSLGQVCIEYKMLGSVK